MRVDLVLAAALTLSAATSYAGPQGRPQTLVERSSLRSRIEVDLIARANPLGFAAQLLAGVELPYGGVDATYGPRAHLRAGVVTVLSPASVSGGLQLEWMPALFAVLSLRAELYGFFGANAGLLSFARADDDFGPSTLSERMQRDAEVASGQRLLFEPLLRAKLGGLVLRVQGKLAYHYFSGRGPLFYEAEHDTLLRRHDLLLGGSAAALWQVYQRGRHRTLLLGARYEVHHGLRAGLGRQRLGAVAFWQPSDGGGSWGRPRVYLLVGVNLKDPNRRGRPYALLGGGTSF